MFGSLLFGQMDKYVLFGMKDAMLYAKMYVFVCVSIDVGVEHAFNKVKM